VTYVYQPLTPLSGARVRDPCNKYIRSYIVSHDARIKKSDRLFDCVECERESPQHQGLSNKLALPGIFEKQFSRSTIVDRLTVNRIRSQSGRAFDLKLKSSRRQRPIIGAMTSDSRGNSYASSPLAAL
jgi:hypothetical protein